MEALALLVGVKFGLSLDYSFRVLESDSLILITQLNSPELDLFKFGSIISNIKFLVTFFSSCFLRQVRRMGNIPAHLLVPKDRSFFFISQFF